MALRKGMGEVQKALEKAASGGGDYTPTSWFNWKDQETKFIRFLTDGDAIARVDVHNNVTRHDGSKTGLICQLEFADTCELVDEEGKHLKAKESIYGVAVLRRPKREDGKTVGYEDVVGEIETVEDGKPVKKPAPVVGIVRQAPSNFWYYFKERFDRHGTLRDRDYEIKRSGMGMNDTKYIFDECPPQEIANIDERYKKYTPDLDQMLERMASKEFYDKQLRGITTKKEDGEQKSDTSTNGGSSSSDDAEEFARLQKVAEEIKAEQVTEGASYE